MKNHHNVPTRIVDEWASRLLVLSVVGKSVLHFAEPGAYTPALCGVSGSIYSRTPCPDVLYTVCGKCAQLAVARKAHA
jgi:hypothetical protein